MKQKGPRIPRAFCVTGAGSSRFDGVLVAAGRCFDLLAAFDVLPVRLVDVDAVRAAATFQAAIDLLPPWARAMHGLAPSRLSRPMVTGGTLALARTLRWAFR